MAIYHLSASIIKRSAGRSVTAAAAYRAAAKIEDLKTGIIHDYTRKQAVDYSEIISPAFPNSNSSNQWLTNRAELWNKIELIEKRKDAQLAREVTIAIPKELSKPDQIALVREYVNTNYVAAGMIADLNLHHLDGDNPHAHILLTMRNLKTSPAGVVEFGLKNTDWNSKELLLAQRKSWEEVTNKYLAARGLDARIDCRSLEEQGSPFIPQIHVGVHAMAMKRKGIATDRGEKFDRIESANNDIRARLEEIYQQEYTEPELNVEQSNYANETIEEKNRQLVEFACEITKDSNLFIKYHGYKLKQHHQDYIEIRTNKGAGAKILEIQRENEQWNVKAKYPNGMNNTHSKSYVDYLIEEFKDCVREPHNIAQRHAKLSQKEHELGESIYNLMQLHGEKRRTFWPLRFHINDEENQIKVYDRKFPTCKTGKEYDIGEACIFNLVDDRWKKTGNYHVIDLAEEIEELIDEAELTTSLQFCNYDLGVAEKILIQSHYAKNGDVYNKYRDYRIHASKQMLEAGWEPKAVEFILDIKFNPAARYGFEKKQEVGIEWILEQNQVKPEILEILPKIETAEKTAAIEIESLAPIQQPIATRPRPPDRKPISEGDPRVRLRAMTNKTHQPTVDLINERDLPIEAKTIEKEPEQLKKPTQTIDTVPVVEIVKPIESIQADETPPPNLKGIELTMWKIEQQNKEFAKEYLRKKAEEQKLNPKPQATRKPNRGFEL